MTLAPHLTNGECDALDNAIIERAISAYRPSKWETLGIIGKLNQARNDVHNLDSWTTDPQRAFHYRIQYLNALRSPDAVQAIYQVARLSWDKKATRSMTDAHAQSLDSTVPILAFRIRELLRDGNGWEKTIQICCDSVNEAIREGREHLFSTLGEIETRYRSNPEGFVRSAEGWMIRAWLPLGLWICDSREAERRITEAHHCLASGGGRLPHMPNFPAFEHLYSKVRSRLATGRR